MANHQFSTSALPAPEETTNITPEQFAQYINESYQPLVIRGFATHWPMVERPVMTMELLKKASSNRPVNVVRLPPQTQGRMFYNDDLSGMNFQKHQTTMTDALQRMENPQDGDRLCVQCVSAQEHFPSLVSQLTNLLLPNVQPLIWLGNDITVAPHFDEANNLAVVANGRRRFTLFEPQQIENLYVGPLDFTPAGQPISLVDVRNPDLERFPNYPKAYERALSVELQAGDAIYIPTPWWHHVEALDDFNVLVNYWWSENYLSSQLPFPMLMHSLVAFNNMPKAQQAAWFSMLQHYLGESAEQAAAHLPDHAKGILTTHAKDASTLIHQWLAAQIK